MNIQTIVQTPRNLTCVKDGLFHIFSTSGPETPMEYRLGGIKPLFVTSLRVTIRIKNGLQNCYDSLDLYAARNRSGFAQSVQSGMGIDALVIERDLAAILEYLEKERDEALLQNTPYRKQELTTPERISGLEFLQSPNLNFLFWGNRFIIIRWITRSGKCSREKNFQG